MRVVRRRQRDRPLVEQGIQRWNRQKGGGRHARCGERRARKRGNLGPIPHLESSTARLGTIPILLRASSICFELDQFGRERLQARSSQQAAGPPIVVVPTRDRQAPGEERGRRRRPKVKTSARRFRRHLLPRAYSSRVGTSVERWFVRSIRSAPFDEVRCELRGQRKIKAARMNEDELTERSVPQLPPQVLRYEKQVVHL